MDAVASLARAVEETASLNSKLILLVGGEERERSQLLRDLGKSMGAQVLNVGASLGARLAPMSRRQRQLEAVSILRELSPQAGSATLLDRIELLFDTSLQLDPLDVLKRLGRDRPTVVVWPGAHSGDRLSYAELGHPEHQEYSTAGVVVFPVDKQ